MPTSTSAADHVDSDVELMHKRRSEHDLFAPLNGTDGPTARVDTRHLYYPDPKHLLLETSIKFITLQQRDSILRTMTAKLIEPRRSILKSEDRTGSSSGKKVFFDEISIQEYPIILGDNPAV